MTVRFTYALAATIAALTALLPAGRAHACGCFSPPEPPPGVSAQDYAVAQQSEQIIFEVEEGFVTAHVLIRYQGEPESFAWIVPVPSEPELSLSENVAFGLLDPVTQPFVVVGEESICPEQEWQCRRHPSPRCAPPPGTRSGGGADAGAAIFLDAGAAPGADAGAADGEPPPVEVISREVIGSYDTVVFAAADAGLAVTWLSDEGFIVNDTMTPFMQPYLDAGMLFVASRLVPGAGVDEIRPLKMRYAASQPMIPLQLTAVAAEPHLTVTSYVYGETAFEPDGLPLVTIDQDRLSRDATGRINYPMVLASSIDEAGGDAFVVEYAGVPPVSDLGTSTCCTGARDVCGISGDGSCQCPGSPLDEGDCSAIPGIVEGVALVNELASRHRTMTRLTTRISPEEMDFDPAFRPAADMAGPYGRLSLSGSRKSLAACEADVLDEPLRDSIEALQGCSTVYCGGLGECAVTTDEQAGCACGPGTVARTFDDLDGRPSVTCVPDTPPVDLAAAGITLPDACDGVDCGDGDCVDLGGFAACRCDRHAAAVPAEFGSTTCVPIVDLSGVSGAEDFSGALEAVRVCAPAPPTSCGTFGWLERRTGVTRHGVDCPSSRPDPALLEIPPAPTCADLGMAPPGGGGGCNLSRTTTTLPLAALLSLLGVGLLVRRRRRRR